MTGRELTAETVVDRVVPRTPRLSPDGRWVAYVTAPVGRTGSHPVSALWLVPADGSAPPRELVAGEAEHREPRWTADSGAILFLSDRAERGTAQLYRIGLTGEPLERLTDRPAGIHGHLPPAGSGLGRGDRPGRPGRTGRPAGVDRLRTRVPVFG